MLRAVQQRPFTARVMFYAERYAGSWQHGEYGGLMYGTIAPLSD